MSRNARIQEGLEAKSSLATKEAIGKILDGINHLSAVDKLLLYLKLPTHNPTPVEPPKPMKSAVTNSFAINWIRTHLEGNEGTSLLKQKVYEEYRAFCETHNHACATTPEFGRLLRATFPSVKARRLGKRGNAKYMYGGIGNLANPRPGNLPDIVLPKSETDDNETDYDDDVGGAVTQSALTLVLDWACRLLERPFPDVRQLARHLVERCYVNTQSAEAFSILAATSPEDPPGVRLLPRGPLGGAPDPPAPLACDEATLRRQETKTHLLKTLQKRNDLRTQRSRMEEGRTLVHASFNGAAYKHPAVSVPQPGVEGRAPLTTLKGPVRRTISAPKLILPKLDGGQGVGGSPRGGGLGEYRQTAVGVGGGAGGSSTAQLVILSPTTTRPGGSCTNGATTSLVLISSPLSNQIQVSLANQIQGSLTNQIQARAGEFLPDSSVGSQGGIGRVMSSNCGNATGAEISANLRNVKNVSQGGTLSRQRVGSRVNLQAVFCDDVEMPILYGKPGASCTASQSNKFDNSRCHAPDLNKLESALSSECNPVVSSEQYTGFQALLLGGLGAEEGRPCEEAAAMQIEAVESNAGADGTGIYVQIGVENKLDFINLMNGVKYPTVFEACDGKQDSNLMLGVNTAEKVKLERLDGVGKEIDESGNFKENNSVSSISGGLGFTADDVIDWAGGSALGDEAKSSGIVSCVDNNESSTSGSGSPPTQSVANQHELVSQESRNRTNSDSSETGGHMGSAANQGGHAGSQGEHGLVPGLPLEGRTQSGSMLGCKGRSPNKTVSSLLREVRGAAGGGDGRRFLNDSRPVAQLLRESREKQGPATPSGAGLAFDWLPQGQSQVFVQYGGGQSSQVFLQGGQSQVVLQAVTQPQALQGSGVAMATSLLYSAPAAVPKSSQGLEPQAMKQGTPLPFRIIDVSTVGSSPVALTQSSTISVSCSSNGAASDWAGTPPIGNVYTEGNNEDQRQISGELLNRLLRAATIQRKNNSANSQASQVVSQINQVIGQANQGQSPANQVRSQSNLAINQALAVKLQTSHAPVLSRIPAIIARGPQAAVKIQARPVSAGKRSADGVGAKAQLSMQQPAANAAAAQAVSSRVKNGIVSGMCSLGPYVSNIAPLSRIHPQLLQNSCSSSNTVLSPIGINGSRSVLIADATPVASILQSAAAAAASRKPAGSQLARLLTQRDSRFQGFPVTAVSGSGISGSSISGSGISGLGISGSGISGSGITQSNLLSKRKHASGGEGCLGGSGGAPEPPSPAIPHKQARLFELSDAASALSQRRRRVEGCGSTSAAVKDTPLYCSTPEGGVSTGCSELDVIMSEDQQGGSLGGVGGGSEAGGRKNSSVGMIQGAGASEFGASSSNRDIGGDQYINRSIENYTLQQLLGNGCSAIRLRQQLQQQLQQNQQLQQLLNEEQLNLQQQQNQQLQQNLQHTQQNSQLSLRQQHRQFLHVLLLNQQNEQQQQQNQQLLQQQAHTMLHGLTSRPASAVIDQPSAGPGAFQSSRPSTVAAFTFDDVLIGSSGHCPASPGGGSERSTPLSALMSPRGGAAFMPLQMYDSSLTPTTGDTLKPTAQVAEKQSTGTHAYSDHDAASLDTTTGNFVPSQTSCFAPLVIGSVLGPGDSFQRSGKQTRRAEHQAHFPPASSSQYINANQFLQIRDSIPIDQSAASLAPTNQHQAQQRLAANCKQATMNPSLAPIGQAGGTGFAPVSSILPVRRYSRGSGGRGGGGGGKSVGGTSASRQRHGSAQDRSAADISESEIRRIVAELQSDPLLLPSYSASATATLTSSSEGGINMAAVVAPCPSPLSPEVEEITRHGGYDGGWEGIGGGGDMGGGGAGKPAGDRSFSAPTGFATLLSDWGDISFNQDEPDSDGVYLRPALDATKAPLEIWDDWATGKNPTWAAGKNPTRQSSEGAWVTRDHMISGATLPPHASPLGGSLLMSGGQQQQSGMGGCPPPPPPYTPPSSQNSSPEFAAEMSSLLGAVESRAAGEEEGWRGGTGSEVGVVMGTTTAMDTPSSLDVPGGGGGGGDLMDSLLGGMYGEEEEGGWEKFLRADAPWKKSD